MLSSMLARPRYTQLLASLVVLNGHISSNDADVLGLLIAAGGPATVHVKQTRLTALASTSANHYWH